MTSDLVLQGLLHDVGQGGMNQSLVEVKYGSDSTDWHSSEFPGL